MFVISERQEGLHASLNFSGSETAFHGEEEQSTKLVSSTGTQWYTGCSVMADNLGKKFTVWSHGICLIQGGGGRTTPPHPLQNTMQGSTLVEYTISKEAGHNTAETSSAEPLAGLSVLWNMPYPRQVNRKSH